MMILEAAQALWCKNQKDLHPSYSTSSGNSNDYHRIERFSALRSETKRAFHLIKCSQENQLTDFRQGQNITAQRVKPPALVKNLQRTRCCSQCFKDQRHQHHLGARNEESHSIPDLVNQNLHFYQAPQLTIRI